MKKVLTMAFCVLAQSAIAAPPPDVAGVTFGMTPVQAENTIKQKFGSYEKATLVDRRGQAIGSIYYFPRRFKDPKQGNSDSNIGWMQQIKIVANGDRITKIFYDQYINPCPKKGVEIFPMLKEKYSHASEGTYSPFRVVWHYHRSGKLVATPETLECDECEKRSGGVEETPYSGRGFYSPPSANNNKANTPPPKPDFICASPWSNKFYEDQEDCGFTIGAQYNGNEGEFPGQLPKACSISMVALDVTHQREVWMKNNPKKPTEPPPPSNKARF